MRRLFVKLPGFAADKRRRQFGAGLGKIINSIRLMYGVRSYRSKILVWLTVMLMPLQAMPATLCDCQRTGQQGDGVQGQEAVAGKDSPCRPMATGCCGGRPAKSRSCCEKRPEVPVRCCCGSLPTCTCQHDHTPPPVPQAPPEGRSRTADQPACAVTAVSLVLDQPLVPLEQFGVRSPISPVTAAKRCTVLCRFHL